MIKKLRRKFILINMILVTAVLITVFAILIYSNYKQYDSKINETLSALLEEKDDDYDGGHKMDVGKGPDKSGYSSYPGFIVTYRYDNNDINVSDENNISVTDALARQLAEEVVASGKEKGNISEYNLSYLTDTTSGGIKIAFVEYTHAIDSLAGLAVNCLLVFVMSIIAFFVISLYLAKWALRPVERAWNQQQQFLADASHELKTPLTVILANLNILSGHKEDTIENQYTWIDSTKTETKRMKELVDDLLFLARSDSDTVPYALQEFDLSDAVWNCTLPMESMAFEQDITMKQEIETAIRMVGIESQIKQLIIILLDNACKYSGINGIVSLRLYRRQDNISIEVNNTGEPIPEEDRTHLFERFYRGDKSRVRKEGGYGLGLSIAKTIVEKHQGKIWVESNGESGTTFYVTFNQKGETDKS